MNKKKKKKKHQDEQKNKWLTNDIQTKRNLLLIISLEYFFQWIGLLLLKY